MNSEFSGMGKQELKHTLDANKIYKEDPDYKKMSSFGKQDLENIWGGKFGTGYKPQLKVQLQFYIKNSASILYKKFSFNFI